MPRYLVFGRKDSQEQMRYVGEVDAPNPEMGLSHARQCFSRRDEADEIWLAPADTTMRFRRSGSEGLDHSYREIQTYADLGKRRRLIEANIPATRLTEDETLSSSGPDLHS